MITKKNNLNKKYKKKKFLNNNANKKSKKFQIKF